MAGYQKESGVCTGRGFAASSPNGFLEKFKTWIVKAYAAGGPLWYILDDQSALATNPYIIISDTAAPAANDYNTAPNGGAPKILKVGYVSTEAGYIRVNGYMWWNSATHVGYGLWCGYRLDTYDDADFAYDFRGGEECLIIQTRLGTSWDSFIIDDWEYMSGLVEATTAIGTLQAQAAAGSSVTIQLDVGEAANFTVDKYYYICNFNGVAYVDYCKVTARDLINDTITVDQIGLTFAAGSIIGAYPHRWVVASSGAAGGVANLNYTGYNSKMPYVSTGDTSYSFHNQSSTIYGACALNILNTVLDNLSPDDENYYAVMRAVLVEVYKENSLATTTANMNRAYGRPKNIYVCSLGSMARALDGMTINGDNWLYFKDHDEITTFGSSIFATLFRDTTHTS